MPSAVEPAGRGVPVFVNLNTRTPYPRDYEGPQGNKLTHYMLRWINSRGEVGPWKWMGERFPMPQGG